MPLRCMTQPLRWGVKIAGCLVFLAAFGSSASAADYEPGTWETPPASPCAEARCAARGDVGAILTAYLFTGEFYASTIDLRVKGRGFDFVFARKYRSRVGPNTAQGNGWDFSYDIRLEESGPDLLLRDGHSRADVYRAQPDGSWARSEFFRSIQEEYDGSFTLTFPDTSRWHFFSLAHPTAAGRIDAIIDRNGNTMTFGYDSWGRLAIVYDTLNGVGASRYVLFTHDADGLLSTVTDWTGRPTTYSHYQDGDAGGSAGDLRSVTPPAVTGTPNGNDFPSGKTTTYTYTRGFADERLNHNLLTITDPKGQTFLTNVYSSTTDPEDIEFDRVMRQIHG